MHLRVERLEVGSSSADRGETARRRQWPVSPDARIEEVTMTQNHHFRKALVPAKPIQASVPARPGPGSQ